MQQVVRIFEFPMKISNPVWRALLRSVEQTGSLAHPIELSNKVVEHSLPDDAGGFEDAA